jgi:predicted MPP superfamily phosphohydrolase
MQLEVARVEVFLEKLPEQAENLRVVVLGDLHWDHPNSSTLSSELLEQVIKESNSLSPDLILITGETAPSIRYLRFDDVFRPGNTDIFSGDFIVRDPSTIYYLAQRLQELKRLFHCVRACVCICAHTYS